MTQPREQSREQSRGRSLERRARGAYYTPRDAAHFLATWLVRGGGERYLEPSFGGGVFLEAVRDVVAASALDPPEWVAGELDEATAHAAVARGLVTAGELRVGDFLEQPMTLVDGVIANPPFVRLRHLDARPRAVAQARAREFLHAPMDHAGSAWVPFVLTMIASIRPGGRLAVVLPVEFTYISYANPLWEQLGRSFSSLRVLRSRERVFGELSQDVVILLADGRGGRTRQAEFEAYESVADMIAGTGGVGGPVQIQSIRAGERAFQRALLPDGVDALLAEAATTGRTVPVADLASVRIGYVTGHQRFFHPPPPIAREYDLPPESLRPALVTARRLRGRGLWTSGVDDDEMDRLWLPDGELTAGEERYVRRGEVRGIDRGFTTRRRTPWYRVPGVRPPDAIITVFSDRPMLMLNDAASVASNSLLCIHLHGATAGLEAGGSAAEGPAAQGSAAERFSTERFSPERFAAAWYNPLTLLSIGLEVRSLGGGLVVMVPREASRVAVLNPAAMPERDVARVAAEVDSELRCGDPAAAYEAGARGLHHAVGRDGVELVRQGVEALSRWRTG